MLQLVFQFPLSVNLLERFGAKDAVLFLENAVFGLLKTAPHQSSLSEWANNGRVYVLSDELETRGLSIEDLLFGIQVIDYQGFVDLTIAQKAVCSWT